MSPARRTPSKKVGEPPQQRAGRHPQATHTELRFTDDAIDDLVQLQKKNRPALEWAMKKFVVIERSPEAGEPLGGVLSGFRKLTIGDRDWRVVWRVTSDNSGTTVVDIGEIWAVGARKDSEVYAGMRARLAALPSNHQTKTIQQVLDLLESKTKRKKPAARITEDPESVAAPSWLVDDLVNFAGYQEDVARHLTEAQALKAWASFRSNEY